MFYSIALFSLLSLSTAVSLPSVVHSGAKHFSYDPNDGDVGPGYWNHVSKKCGKGGQSPINIVTQNEVTAKRAAKKRPRIKLAKKLTLSISHGAHNFALGCKKIGKCGKTKFEGKTYHFVGLHFHSSSEHTMDGKHFPLEMHMVHQAKDEAYAVVATLFDYSENGEDNVILDKILDSVEAGDEDVDLRLRKMLQGHNGYHVYMGSLTTPPCTQGVTWIIAEKHLTASKSQIKRFLKDVHSVQFGNNRPVQDSDGRVITKYGFF